MENANPSAFEVTLQAATSRTAGSLKVSDIKRLIKLLGKRPNEIGVRHITELIASRADNEILVYELLCEIEMTRNPDLTLAVLKPTLSQIAVSWMGTPPPIGRQPETLDWLRVEAAEIMSPTQPNLRRFRGVLLWAAGAISQPGLFPDMPCGTVTAAAQIETTIVGKAACYGQGGIWFCHGADR